MKILVTQAQQEILEHPARFKIAACGRRWGKSTLQAIAMMIMAKRYPGSKIWYVSTDLGRVMEQLRAMEKNQAFMRGVKRKWGQFPPRFEMRNGAEIGFRSCDRPDRLVGRGLQFIAFDEASRAPETVWYQILLPMLADTHGSALLGSTFNGRNWFYDLAQKGLASNDLSIKTWIHPSATGLAFQDQIGREDLEQLRRQTPLPIWKQEYECEPLAAIDQAFKFVDDCVRGSLLSRPAGGRYVLAVDIGSVSDPAAVVILDARNGQVVYFEEFPLGTRHEVQAERCRAIARLFGVVCTVVDVTGGGMGGHGDPVAPIYTRTLPGAHQVVWTAAWKYKAVHWLDKLMQDRAIGIPADAKELYQELKNYRFYPSAHSEICHYSAPKGERDDLVSALLMAAWALHPNNQWAGGAAISVGPG